MDLLSLPKDLLAEILLYIPINRLAKISLCCHYFRRLCSNNAWWKQQFMLEFPDRSSLFEGEKDFTNYLLKQRFIKNYPGNIRDLGDVNFINVYKQLFDFRVTPAKLDDSNRYTYITSEIMPRIFRKLRLLSKSGCQGEKLYVASGDPDFTTRDFDRKSLYLQLGVRCNSEYVASILLSLLKFLISSNCYNFSGHYLYFQCDKNISVPFPEFLDRLKAEATDNKGNINSFDLDKPLVYSFRWGNDYGFGQPEVVKNTIDQVDIWTLDRVKKAVYEFKW